MIDLHRRVATAGKVSAYLMFVGILSLQGCMSSPVLQEGRLECVPVGSELGVASSSIPELGTGRASRVLVCRVRSNLELLTRALERKIQVRCVTLDTAGNEHKRWFAPLFIDASGHPWRESLGDGHRDSTSNLEFIARVAVLDPESPSANVKEVARELLGGDYATLKICLARVEGFSVAESASLSWTREQVGLLLSESSPVTERR